MPKINVYLPDELAQAVKESGVPVSAICQRALDQAVRRITAIRSAALADLTREDLAATFPNVTARARDAIAHAVEAARERGAALAGTGDLLAGVLAQEGNLALRVLELMEIDPAVARARLDDREEDGPGGPGRGDGLRWGGPAAAALELAATEAIASGHNYIGCEHLLVGLVTEPDGTAGRVLRDLGAEQRAVRRTVESALMGYTHLRAQQAATQGAAGGQNPAQAVAALVRAELQPLLQRLDRLERHAGLDPEAPGGDAGD